MLRVVRVVQVLAEMSLELLLHRRAQTVEVVELVELVVLVALSLLLEPPQELLGQVELQPKELMVLAALVGL